jgi:hypothetical protein
VKVDSGDLRTRPPPRLGGDAIGDAPSDDAASPASRIEAE